MIEKPLIIDGDSFVDERGILSFVNDFEFNDVKRFYIISNYSEKIIRAWQGHKIERKYFYSINGSFVICAVKIDNWDKPSLNLPVEKYILNDKKSQILMIPPGYANGIKALKHNSKLLVFSSLSFENAKNDDYRFNKKLWYDWYSKKIR